jgi:hypothetical protein
MKYELTDEKIIVEGHTLFRIRALKDFGEVVKAGNLGGFVESEKNLSQKDYAWVADNSCVFENARVFENAWIFEKSWVFGKVQVSGYSKVFGGARLSGNEILSGYTWVNPQAVCHTEARVYGNAQMIRSAWVQK